MTLNEMALAAGFRSRSSIFHHCRGVRVISAESAMKYHRAFSIPLHELRPDLWPPDGPTATPTTPPEPEHSEGGEDAA